MANKIQIRRDSASNWAAFNPVLAEGELGLDTTNGYMKFGDGLTPWNECMYVRFPGVGPDNLSITGTPGAGTVGLAYSFVPTITGGTPPYTVTNIGASLPAGTTLNSSTGAITGTLSGSAQSYTGIILRVADSQGNVATLNLAAIVVSAGVVNAPPVNTALPTITGTAQVGQTLTSTTGAWTGTPTPTYGRQWLRDGSVISGATGTTYSPVTGDIGATISVRVTATNSEGSAQATSAATAAVTAAPADSRARFGYGTATAGVSSPEALLASMTVFGTANASKAGSFTSAPPSGQYVWAAFEADASAAGVTFTVALGPGGWQGASSSGPNFDDPGSSPNTSTVTAVINGVTWRFFRTSFANAADDWTTS